MKLFSLVFLSLVSAVFAQTPLAPGTYFLPTGTTISVSTPTPTPTPIPVSASGTTVSFYNNPVGTIVDTAGNVWSINSAAQITRNGVADPNTWATTLFWNGTLYSGNPNGAWSSWSGSAWSSSQSPLPVATPTPTPVSTPTPTPTPSPGTAYNVKWVGVDTIGGSPPDWTEPVNPFAAPYDFNMMMDYQDGWSSIESSQGNYNLTQIKAEYAWTRANHIGMAWDGALFHASIPSYISGLSGQAGAAAWVSFVQAVAAACPDIEVVVAPNEYLEFKYTLGSLPAFLTYIDGIAPWNGLNINNTYDTTENEAWVPWAVSILHQYFPNSVIVTEEYNCESHSQSYDSAHQAVINIAIACKPYGLGGVGMEGFFGNGYFAPSASDLLAGMNDFKNQVGLPVYITSLVYSSTDDAAQLAMAQSLTPAILSNGNCALFQVYYLGANLSQYGGDPGWDWINPATGVARPAFTWLLSNVKHQ